MQLPRLQRTFPLTGTGGVPSQAFQIWWQRFAEQIETQLDAINGNAADILAIGGDLSAVDVSLASLDARIDAYDALAPFVREDQTPAWADPTGTLARTTFAAASSFTVSATPTQAEVQAIADHLVLVSQRLAAVLTDLRANNVLT